MVTKRNPARPAPSRRRNGAARKPSRASKTSRIPKRRKGEDLDAYLIRLGDSIPASELKMYPPDGAANHDHYIYGSSKQY